ncbi:MAG: hypothetical protein ACO1OO_06220 [Flavisolibacter sp.]
MACSFSIALTGSADATLNRARAAVESQGGQFAGDTNSGNFNVVVFGNTIAGNYVLNGEALQITITEKPMLVSCGMIESYLKGQIN